jgi:hypothetical protein
MASNSATKLATQQSIKAYVDAQVGTVDTLAEVLANGNTTGGTDIAVSTGDDITFADSSKAIFGGGSDLQIYHDPAAGHSYIKELGAGNLIIDGTNLTIRDSNTAKVAISVQNNTNAPLVQLRYDNAPKLTTTSTGIDVTGTITADGLTVDGSATIKDATSPSLRFLDTNAVNSDFTIYSPDGVNSLRIKAGSNATDAFSIASSNDISFYEDTGTTAKFFWDASAESLGIGTSSPASIIHSLHPTSPKLTLERDSTSLANNNVIGEIAMAHKDSNDAGTAVRIIGRAEGTGGAAGLAFNTGLPSSIEERLRIDSSGNVGIGTDSPSAPLTVYNSSTPRITVGYSSTQNHYLGWDSSKLVFQADPQNLNAASAILFSVDGSEAMRISSDGSCRWTPDGTNPDMTLDASGNLLVGKTVTTLNTEGHALAPTFARFTRNGAAPVQFNRTTSDGDITIFYKDGAPVGSIRSLSGDSIGIGTGVTGLRFVSGTNRIQPVDMSTGLNSDALTDLGDTNKRFQDLYLSGGVYLGGTGAANKLDDYEEGQYDAAITCGTSGTITLSTSYNRASYVKVGSLVHVQGLLITSAVSSPTGFFEISLPFTVANLTDRAGDSSGSILVHGSSANVRDFVCMINEGVSKLLVYLGDATTRQEDSANAITANVQINFQCSYRTT